MKLTNLAIVFSVLFICIFTVLDMKERHMETTLILQNKYNNILDNAVDDAMVNLIEADLGREKIINLNELKEDFFTNLYINFDVIGDYRLENVIKMHVPVISVVLEKGVCFLYQKLEDNNLITVQTDLIPYVFEDKYNKFYFSLSDFIKVESKTGDYVSEGYFNDLSGYFVTELGTYEKFEIFKRNVIINTISENINKYIKTHNKIAEQKGINYKFSIPFISKENWYRTINDISLIVLFQGYPFGNSTIGNYNKVAIGGARIYKDVNN